MWGALISQLLGKVAGHNAEGDANVQAASKSPSLTEGFQVAQPATKQSSGLGGMIGSAAGGVGGGSTDTTPTANSSSPSPTAGTDLDTSNLGGATQSVDPATGKPTSSLTGFAGLKTKLY